jgi:radical SAM protein
MARMPIDLEQRPMLVFWETTRACLLSCRHCRACAQPTPLPDQLSTEEGLALIEQLSTFGDPAPVLIATGGDVLMRPDLDRLARRGAALHLPLALSPSVTPLLTAERAGELRRLGVKVASISLDGATAGCHEGIRGVPGHFEATLRAIRLLRAAGITVQVNTLVMRENVEELPEVAAIVAREGASIWELFFLVQVGRGEALEELSPAENEDVCHFLFDASRYGFVVRTVEAPFFRRVVAWRREHPEPRGTGALYERLAAGLRARLGEPAEPPKAQTKGTRDGKGIVFVAHNGDVYPAGFLPLVLGNVRDASLVEIYRDHPLLRDIRAGRFSGRCGTCAYTDLCGGSRARAYAASGDPLGEDPACAYVQALP